MKAIGYVKSLPIEDKDALQDIDVEKPQAFGQDILVKVRAIAVNPVDYKIRQNVSPDHGDMKILGWDAVGDVVAVGDQVTRFALGDTVFYAGDLNRQGSNAEYQLVDERIVGKKPSTVSHSEAAALPLTAITAWELLFEHLAIDVQSPDDIQATDQILLITGAAGGVGSILIQLAKRLTGVTVIATASRPSSVEWVTSLGADYVIDHSQPFKPQIDALNIGNVTHVASLNGTDKYLDTYVELLVPFGKIALIDDPGHFDISKIKPKSLSLHWEFMFARSMFNAKDLSAQGELLDRVSELVDLGYIRTTVGQHLGTINAEHLRKAHQLLESGRSIGKIVLETF